jgi:hypothetical protein
MYVMWRIDDNSKQLLTLELCMLASSRLRQICESSQKLQQSLQTYMSDNNVRNPDFETFSDLFNLDDDTHHFARHRSSKAKCGYVTCSSSLPELLWICDQGKKTKAPDSLNREDKISGTWI